MKLREYQEKAIAEVRAAFHRKVRRVILQMPCGAGKTVVFTTMMKSALANGFPSLMVVRGKELVHQTARRFDTPVNIYQGNNTNELASGITIASIATLYSRRHIPPARLTIIDECHLSFGESYKWLMENISKDTFVIGTTATPYNSKGFRHIADEIVYPISITELQEKGFLVPGKYYLAEMPDLSGVKVTAGEFNEGQLGKLMLNRLCADTISSWNKHSERRPTIVFCVNVKHAESVAELYNNHGVRTVAVDANTNDQKRAEIFTALRNGSINCVSSVGVLTTGVDLPEVSCLQILRPTMSEALWFQMLGRGTRTSEGKKNFLVLDHSTNTDRFGFIEHERKGNIDPLPKSKRENVIPNISSCKVCGIIYSGRGACPECGEEIEIIKKEIKIEKGELKEIKIKEIEKKRVDSLIRKALDYNYKRGWVMFQLIEKFGQEDGMYLYRKHVMPLIWPTNEQSQRTPQNSSESDIACDRSTP